MKVPDLDHPITILPFEGRVTVRAAGATIAKTNRALLLKESSYRDVFYIPREDLDLALLSRSDHQTYCPYKGYASYYSLPTGLAGANAAWTYETPYDAVAPIKDHLAFYLDRVEIEIR